METIDESKWISMYHGMELSPDAQDNRRGNENGVLFLAEYYMMKEMLGELTQEDINTFNSICLKLQSYRKNGEQVKGIYDRGAKESLTEVEPRTPSHDNLTAISFFSFKHNLKFHKDILDYGRKFFWRFDNWNVDKPRWSRIQHPRDMILWGYNGGSWISKLFLPIGCLIVMQACAGRYEKGYGGVMYEDTDGELLSFVRVYYLKDKSWLMKLTGIICNKILIHYWGENYFSKIFGIYFRNPNHPCNVLAREVERRGLKWY